MRVVENAGYVERRDAISHDWSRLFQGYGILPILVPNGLDDPGPYFALGATGVLLTGGDDLGAEEEPTPRDRTEGKILKQAIALKMPVFGACRGLQLINHYFGGSVSRQLPERHVGEHAIRLASGEELRVNSFHNQGVMTNGVAADLDVFADTLGGVVEGVRHRKLPIAAIQWHPERPGPSGGFDRQLLHEWLGKCG